MRAPAGAPARAEALRDLLGDLAAGQVGREQAGGGDGAGGAGAVGDDHGPGQAEQDGAPVALGIQPGGEFAKAAALQERADPRHPGAGHRGPQLGRGEPDRALERFQRDVSCETVGHDHVELARQQVTALHVAREGQRERAVRRIGGQQLVRAPGELVPLAGFGSAGEQPDPRGADAQGELRAAVTATRTARIGAFLQRRGLRELAARLDTESYGGAVLLGLGGTVVIAHGASTARGVTSACLLAADLARGEITEKITQRLGRPAGRGGHFLRRQLRRGTTAGHRL